MGFVMTILGTIVWGLLVYYLYLWFNEKYEEREK